jgi:hypothetical protein
MATAGVQAPAAEIEAHTEAQAGHVGRGVPATRARGLPTSKGGMLRYIKNRLKAIAKGEIFRMLFPKKKRRPGPRRR